MFRIRNERRLPHSVDEHLQKKIVVASCWPVAVGSVISLGTLFFFGSQIDLDALAPAFVSTALLFVAAIVLQAILAIRLAHRIAGSAYRITTTLRAFRLGDRTERVTLRRGDPHGVLAAEVNEFLEWVTRETAALPSRRPVARPISGAKAETPGR